MVYKKLKFDYINDFLKYKLFKKEDHKYICIYVLNEGLFENKDLFRQKLGEVGVTGKFIKTKHF